MGFKIIVDSAEDKQDLLEASEHIHDANVDTDLPMVNTLAHLYLAPDLIEVIGATMKIYKLTNGNAKWEDFKIAIVIAPSKEEAVKIHPNPDFDHDNYDELDWIYLWCKPEEVIIEEIGTLLNDQETSRLVTSSGSGRP